MPVFPLQKTAILWGKVSCLLQIHIQQILFSYTFSRPELSFDAILIKTNFTKNQKWQLLRYINNFVKFIFIGRFVQKNFGHITVFWDVVCGTDRFPSYDLEKDRKAEIDPERKRVLQRVHSADYPQRPPVEQKVYKPSKLCRKLSARTAVESGLEFVHKYRHHVTWMQPRYFPWRHVTSSGAEMWTLQ